MSKNVVFLTSVKYDRFSQKYGGYEWMDISQKSWEFWCESNDVELYVYDKPKKDDPIKHRITWQRWFDVFDKLKSDYDKIWMVDSASIIKWNTPNIFDLLDDRFTAFRDIDNLNWIYQSVVGYKPMFNNFEFDTGKYINCGNAIINKKHQPFLENVERFYYDNHELLLHYENSKVKKGTDQTPFNYLLQIEKIDTNIEMPMAYNLTHLQRKEMLGVNWQLKDDNTPFFIKYGYLWRYNGFPKDTRTNLMTQTWEIVKENYR